MHPRIDSDPETVPCVRVTLPLMGSLSFRPLAAAVDDSPTDVMTRRWWEAQMDLWEPPVPIVPQLPLELVLRPAVDRARACPARRGTDWRDVVAPLSLLLIALSVVPQVGTAPAPRPPARTVAIAMREARTAMPTPGAPVPAVAAVTTVAAVQRRPPPHAPHRSAPRPSAHLVRDVPF